MNTRKLPIFQFLKYKNHCNDSFLFLISYLRFVNCLRYLSDELVTDELMQYAENLINGFDDTVDNALAGEELKPTPVNLKSVFRIEGVLGKGEYLWKSIITRKVWNCLLWSCW